MTSRLVATLIGSTLIAVSAFASTASYAQAVRQDNKDIRQDRRERRQDVREMRQDVRNGDKAGARQEAREIRQDNKDIREDRRQRREDVRRLLREWFTETLHA